MASSASRRSARHWSSSPSCTCRLAAGSFPSARRGRTRRTTCASTGITPRSSSSAKSRWIGQPMADFNRYYDGRLEVVEWLRNGVPQHNKNRGSVLAEGDVLFVSATPDEIVSVESEPGLALHAVKKYGESTERDLDDAAPAGAGRRRAAFAVHRRDHRRSGLPQDLRCRGRGHVAPAGLDTRPPVAGEVERGRPAGTARHAGPVRGARIPSRHPDDGAVLRAATASPACDANAPDRDRPSWSPLRPASFRRRWRSSAAPSR